MSKANVPAAVINGSTQVANVSGTSYTMPVGYSKYVLTLASSNSTVTVRQPSGIGDRMDVLIQQSQAGGNTYALAPPGSPTITTVGSPVTQATTSVPSSYTVTINPTNIGDIYILWSGTATQLVRSVSGGGVTKWQRINSGFGNSQYGSLWWGTVVATGSTTITVTYNGSSGNGYIWLQEFTAGAGMKWSYDRTAVTSGSGTTVSFPSMTPSTNLGELYFGVAHGVGGTYSAGSSSGFTYSTDNTTYNPSVTTTVAPTATTTGATSQWFTMAVLLTAGSLSLTYSSGVSPIPTLTAGAVDKYTFISPDGVNWIVEPAYAATTVQGSMSTSQIQAPITLVDTTTQQNAQVEVPWAQFSMANDPQMAIDLRYSGHGGASHSMVNFGDWRNGTGFVIEHASAENILIFGARYMSGGNSSFGVGTYIDNNNVWHYSTAMAIDANSANHSAPTSGTVTWRMPFIGTNFKLLTLQFVNYVNNTATNDTWNTQTGGYAENYQVPFSTSVSPIATANNTGLSVSLIGTASPAGNAITVTTPNSTTPYTGWIVFMGV